MTPTPWRPCGQVRSWSTTPAPARSGGTGSCGGSFGEPGLAGRAPRTDRDGRRDACRRAGRRRAAGPPGRTTGGRWPGRWRSSPSPPTTGRWCSAPTAASGRSTEAPGRPPILPPGADRPDDVVGRYQATLKAGDLDGVVTPSPRTGTSASRPGRMNAQRGPRAAVVLRRVLQRRRRPRPAALRGDRRRRARRGGVQLRPLGQPRPPSPGRNRCYERGPDGLLAAARVYDDVEAPVERG